MQTPERDFTIKISGLEIYNENVRDLLNSDSGRNLKLLDDPEVIVVFCVCHMKVIGRNWKAYVCLGYRKVLWLKNW